MPSSCSRTCIGAHELGEPPLVAAVTGSNEIGFAVIATTLTLAAVFVPISFLPGRLGRLFSEFGFTLAAVRAVLGARRADADADAGIEAAGARAAQSVRAAMDRFFRRLASFYERRLRVIVARPWASSACSWC